MGDRRQQHRVMLMLGGSARRIAAGAVARGSTRPGAPAADGRRAGARGLLCRSMVLGAMGGAGWGAVVAVVLLVAQSVRNHQVLWLGLAFDCPIIVMLGLWTGVVVGLAAGGGVLAAHGRSVGVTRAVAAMAALLPSVLTLAIGVTWWSAAFAVASAATAAVLAPYVVSQLRRPWFMERLSWRG